MRHRWGRKTCIRDKARDSGHPIADTQRTTASWTSFNGTSERESLSPLLDLEIL